MYAGVVLKSCADTLVPTLSFCPLMASYPIGFRSHTYGFRGSYQECA